MNEEIKPGDVKRGVVKQREHASGRVTVRDPKKIKLEYQHFEGEPWALRAKYHTVADAEKALKSLKRSPYGGFNNDTTKWRIDGNEVS